MIKDPNNHLINRDSDQHSETSLSLVNECGEIQLYSFIVNEVSSVRLPVYSRHSRTAGPALFGTGVRSELLRIHYLLGVESDFIGSGRRGFYPLMSDESCQNVPEEVDPGLRAQTHFPGHPAVRDEQPRRQAHFVRLESAKTHETIRDKEIRMMPNNYHVNVS